MLGTYLKQLLIHLRGNGYLKNRIILAIMSLFIFINFMDKLLYTFFDKNLTSIKAERVFIFLPKNRNKLTDLIKRNWTRNFGLVK